ncbi:MAG: malyl-CoA thiolesterase [Hyphomicrobiales bacterium]|nr:malyl-CoA thiolesterase [Hyphomicrobiales bacterium]
MIRPRRSALYMPGSNARAIDKARTLDADAVMLDLEDSVAPAQKSDAREQVAAAVRQGGFGRREVVIRVNALESPWGRDDLAAAAAAGPDAVLLPKVSTPGDITLAARALQDAGAPDRTRIWAMIETPLALLNIDSLARTAADPAARLDVFVIGTNDIAKETRARLVPGRAPMLAWLSACVLAARAHGVDVLDGVFNGIGDDAGLRAECEQGRDFGMDGKTLIHPGQIAIANEVFAPAQSEIEAAKKIIQAFALPENTGRGAISLDGRMVELLHADMAARTLAIADALAKRD